MEEEEAHQRKLAERRDAEFAAKLREDQRRQLEEENKQRQVEF